MKSRRFSTSCALWALAAILCETFRVAAGQSSSDGVSSLWSTSSQISDTASSPSSSLQPTAVPSESTTVPSASNSTTGLNWSKSDTTAAATWSAISAALLTSSITSTAPTVLSVANSADSGSAGQSSKSSASTTTPTTTTVTNVDTANMAMASTTPTTAPPTIVVPDQNLASTDQYLLITVIVAPNVNSRSRAFWLLMESRLAQVCQMAFARNQAASLGLYVPYKRRKRVTTLSSVTVQMVNVSRLINYPARLLLVYAVAMDGVAINATVAASVLGLLDVQEIALVLQYVVKQVPQEFNYVAPADLRLWIIGAVLGPVAFVALVWIVTCLVLRNRLRRKQVSAARAKVAVEPAPKGGDPTVDVADGGSSKGMATPLIGWSSAAVSSARDSAKGHPAGGALLSQPDRAAGSRPEAAVALSVNYASDASISASEGSNESRSKSMPAQSTRKDVPKQQIQQQAATAATRPLPRLPDAPTDGSLQPTRERLPEAPSSRLQPRPLFGDALYAEVQPAGRLAFAPSDVDADSSPALQRKQKQSLVSLKHLPSLDSASSQQNIIPSSETESEANDAGSRSPVPRKSRAQMHKILDAVMYAMFDETDFKKQKRHPRSLSTSFSASSTDSSSGESTDDASKGKEPKESKGSRRKKDVKSKSDKENGGKIKVKKKEKKEKDEKKEKGEKKEKDEKGEKKEKDEKMEKGKKKEKKEKGEKKEKDEKKEKGEKEKKEKGEKKEKEEEKEKKKQPKPDEDVAVSDGDGEAEKSKQPHDVAIAAAAEGAAAGISGHRGDEDFRLVDLPGRRPSTVERSRPASELSAGEWLPRAAAAAAEAWASASPQQPIEASSKAKQQSAAARQGAGASPPADEKQHVPLRLQPIRGAASSKMAASQSTPYQAADLVSQMLQPASMAWRRPAAAAAAAAPDSKDSLPPPHAYRGTGPNRVIAGMLEPELAPLSETDGYTSITMTSAMLGLT